MRTGWPRGDRSARRAAALGASGFRRWRRAAVGIVVLVVLVVGVAAGVGGPSRAGAAGLRSNAFHYGTLPCDRYGQYGLGAGGLEGVSGPGQRMNRWVDRVPIAREDGREIVFADGNAVYAASVQGTQLWRPAREDSTFFYVGGRSRYGLEGIVSFDVSRVDGALVYATCWSYQPDGGDPEIAACTGVPVVRASEDDCFKNPPRREVRLAYPGGAVLFDIGDDLYQLTVVRPEAGTVTDLYLGNFPTWSPDGRRIAFVSSFRLGGKSDVNIMAADGTGLHRVRLSAPKHADFPPRWSPDGTRLAFLVGEEAQDGVTFAIYTVRADGTRLRRLAAARSNPAWSPDGGRLAFGQVNRDGDLHLHTMAADGTDVRQITAAPIGPFSESDYPWIWWLAWSPDGTRLLYRCVDTNCVVGLEGQPVGAVGGLLPAWSADGQRIALYNPAHDVQRDRRNDVVLSSIAPDGSDWRVLVREDARAGLVADQAENLVFPGPVATRAACGEGMVVPAPAQHPGLVADCEALVALRAELFGRAATNWTTSTPLAAWEGVVVGGTPARVRELVLTDGTIATFDHGGRLPAGIAELAFLERLELSKNGLTGTIPAEWGALARLRWLNLSGNKLSGTIPPELGNLANLEQLFLYSNRLSGPIPAELGQLGNLQWLWLFDNQLTGTLPAELGNLAQLRNLGFGDNELSGAIPPTLGQFQKLEALGLGGNHLSGPIPPELGQLGNLRWLNLADNQLSGAIPAALGQLGSLEVLTLDNNQLSGAIPPELGQLQSLRGLALTDNQLTGCIPVGLKRPRYYDLTELGLPDCEAGAVHGRGLRASPQ